MEKHNAPDIWDALPEQVKRDVEDAIKQLDREEGMPHAEVMKKYSKYTKQNNGERNNKGR